jgi:hypothetical protein
MGEHKPGFVYIHSDILKQEIALSEKTGTVYCKDGVKYSPEEIAILAENGGVLQMQVHIIKKVFKDSEVVRYANETNAGRKAGEDGTGEGKHNASGSTGKVEAASGDGAGNENIALEIY